MKRHISKILIIRLSSFGDIVLTFPLISEIRKQYPETEIHFLTRTEYTGLLRMNGKIDLIISYDNEKFSKLRREIKKNNYDVIIDLHKNFRSIISTLLLKPVKLRYKKQNIRKFLLVNFKINLFNEIIPVYRKYFKSCERYLNLDNNEFILSDLNFFEERLIKEKYIVIAPVTKHFTKTLPENKFSEIIKSEGRLKIVLISDNVKAEKDVCKRLSDYSDNIINYGGKLKYEALVNILYHSEMVICNDSAILHLSESLGKKVLVFFGSTVKEFGFFPQLPSTIIFENSGLKCRPCTHIGRNSCPKKHFKCMNEIPLNPVLDAVKNQIN